MGALFHRERTGEAEALNGLGEVLRATGQPGPAHAEHSAALAVARQIGDQHEQARACNGLGASLLDRGLPDQARPQYAAALALASQSGDRYEQARALDGLAHSYLAAGDPGQALQHWRRALDRYADLGLPEADAVRAELTALSRARPATSARPA